MKRIFEILLVLIIFELACSSTDNIINPAKVGTNTVIVSATVSSTSLHSSSLTAESSQTLQPSPTDICPPQPTSASVIAPVQKATEAIIPDAKVVWYDNFICRDFSYGWWSPNIDPNDLITIQNSILEIRAENTNDIIASLIRNQNDITDKQGVLVLFRYQRDSSVTLFIDAGEWLDPSYRGWGLAVNGDNLGNNSWFRWKGKYLNESDFRPNITKPETWYYLFIKLGEQGEVTMEMFQKERPTVRTTYHLALGKEWAGKSWKTVFQVTRGILEVSEYWQVEFSNPS